MSFLFHVLWHYLLTRYFPARSTAALQRRQKKRLTHVLNALRRSYFYYRSADTSSLQSLPILDRAVINANFSALNRQDIDLQKAISWLTGQGKTSPFPGTDIFVGLSTGTSGNQGVFLTCEHERAVWAGTILAHFLPYGISRKTRIAVVIANNNELYESLGKSQHIAFRWFSPTNDVTTLVSDLKAFNPHVLFAPPKMLMKIAEHGSLGFKPLRVFSGSDVLEPQEMEYLKSFFSVNVQEIYQATEGFLGISCPHGRVHLNEEAMVFEKNIIDSSGRFVAIITDLYRTSQAMIRVRMSDVLLPHHDACPCGLPTQTIQCIDGRCDEVFIFQTTSGWQRAFRSELRDCLLPTLPFPAPDFQLRQTAPSVFELHVPFDNPLWNKFSNAITALCERKGVLISVRVEIHTGFNPSLNQKRRRFVRTFSDPLGVL
jgi:putative adenylate-forming enzyme